MREKTLTDILGDFTPTPPDPDERVRTGGCVTIWLPAKAKARYDRLQENSGRRFSKKAREAILALMDIAEERAG